MRKQTIILATAIFLILGIFAQVFPLRSQGAGVRMAAKPGVDSAFVQWLDSLLVADSTFITDSVLKDPEYLFYPTLKQPELRIASLGNDAGIIGAALLGKE